MPDSDYSRGHMDGELGARLASLEDHKKIMNGHLAAIEAAVSEIKTEQRRLTDQMAFDATIRAQVALTLKEKTTEEERLSAKKMAPRLRWAAYIVVLPIVFSAVYFVATLVVRDIVTKL